MTIQSGVPQTLNNGSNRSGTNTPINDRPNFTGVGNGYLPKRSPSGWLDPASFSLPAAGTFGNVGRNSITTPHLQSIDLAVHKQFAMPYNERHALQFRLEAFNVFNHPVWGAPNGNINSPAFGTINSTRIAMRQVQLGLKYTF